MKMMFRNRNHAEWFFFTIISVALFIVAYYQAGYRVQLYMGYCLYAIVSAESALMTIAGNGSKYYSPDCVWFNFLISEIFLYFYLKGDAS